MCFSELYGDDKLQGAFVEETLETVADLVAQSTKANFPEDQTQKVEQLLHKH